MKKIKLPVIPASPITFATKKSKKDMWELHLIFQEDLQKIKSVHNSLNSKQIKCIQESIKNKSFEGKKAELQILNDCSSYILGLGKKENFHPDVVAEIFRKLLGRIQNTKKLHLQIVIGTSLKKAVVRFNKQHIEIEKNSKSKKHLFQKEGLSNKFKINANLVYSNYTIEDLISQMSSCLAIGAVKLNFLVTNQSKKNIKGKYKSKLTFSFSKTSINPKKLKEGIAIADLVTRSRYLAHLPGNYLNPLLYENYIQNLARDFNLKMRVFNQKELKTKGFGGILSVAQGSRMPARMIVLEYKPKKAINKKPLVLIGKGVTFDTGGISLKPSPQMHEMKYDMCGSALALHAISLASYQKSPLNITCIVGLAENMPDGNAIKPGDVYTAYNGKTIEVQNTDAEGRLILADILAYTCDKLNPGMILDFATLTGACVISLGHHAAGVMTSSERLFKTIDDASRKSLDKIWRLPHWEMYGSELKSSISDLRNIGGRPAGTISAMRFLAEFVDPQIPWAHFDIAGAAWRGEGHGSQPSGPTGWGVRFMSEFYKNLY